MIPTWGTSTGRSQASLVPSLLLDFSYQTYLLNGSAFAAFGGSPGITFSRGTNATMIDSTGQLTYAPSNQIPNSESFTATTWAPTGLNATTPVVSNTVVAPDGTTTADSIVEDTANSTHRIDYSGLAGNAGKYAASVYLKAGTKTFARLQFDATLNAVSSSAGVQINLTNGTLSSTTVAGNITAATATSEDVGNGWYRVGLIFTISPVYVLAGGSVRIYLMQSLAATPSYIGNGSNIFVWGAQFGAMTYETAPRTYNSTTPKNLLGFTEEFDVTASGWGRSNIATVNANASIAPNGTTTADKVIPNTTSGFHNVSENIGTVQSGNIYTLSVYAKADGYNFIRLNFGNVAGGGFTFFDVLNGAIGGTGSTISNAIENVGNGWFRCSVTRAASSTAILSSDIYVQSANNQFAGWAGNGTDGVLVWGAQISDSASIDPYVYNPAAALTSTAYYGPRFDYNPNYAYTAGNLIPYANPQDFSNNSFWFKARATAPATTATADPAGTYTAYKLTEDTTASASHLIQWQGVNTPVTAGVQYTFSGYVKLADAARPSVQVAIGTDNGAFTQNTGDINLTTGVVSSPVGTAPIVTDAGNGWWRWSITATATASALCLVRTYLIAGVTNVYTGDGTSGAYIWGAQMVAGAAPVPFFYYPLNPLGLLIEEARTNLMFPSDANTGWSASPGGGVDATANASSSPDGTINATKLATGNLSPSGHTWYRLYTGAINTTYCGSAYFKAGEYTRAEITFDNSAFSNIATGALFDLAAGTVVATGGGSTATITAVGNGWYRCSVTATSDADGGNYVFVISPKPASVTTFNAVYSPASKGLGVYVYGVQVEAAAFATSFIPTVNASATRSADVATMVGNNFTNWYNEASGTISASADTVVPSLSNSAILSFQDAAGAATNRHQLSFYTACSATVLSGTVQANLGENTLQSLKSAYAYQDNNFAFSANGTTAVMDASGTVPLTIGYATLGKWDYGASPSLNGHIKAISYFNSRLPNSSLQALTA